MARKSSSGGGLVLIAIAIVIGAIANYWKELLAIGGVVLAAWVIYKVVQSNKVQSPGPSASPSAGSPRTGVSAFVAEARADTSRVTSRNSDEYWIPPTRSVVVAGRSVGGGLYVGTGLGAVAGGGLEPALLDQQLPVDRSVSDCSVRQLNYWPSYQGASPTARAAYLDWLTTGRNRPNADLGYVFLYFYGLERRVLHDARVSDARVSAAAKADLPWIDTELERLLGIYGRSGSFHAYAGSLLDLMRHQVVHARLYDAAPPPVERHRGLGFGHRIALAQCAADGSPLPATWAYTWLIADPTTRLRTSAVRCPEEFQSLFSKRYAAVFGAGMPLPKNKTRLKLERRPASSSFHLGGQGHVLQFDLPDVSVLTSPVKKLQDIAEWCYPKLDGYSRFIRKDGAKKDSFDALLELPLALWPEHSRQVIEKVRTTVNEAQRPAAIPFEKFKSWFPEWQSITRAKMQSLYRVLAEAGLGIEPDIRFGGAVPETASTVVLFADDPASSSPAPSARYTAGALTLQLGAAVALADGHPNDAEKGIMSRQLEEWLHLSESERRRLRAFTRLIFSAPTKLNGIKAKVDALDVSQREAIGDFLALIAQADSVVTPAEIKTLERSYRLLGLDPQRVYSSVHVAATEPVTVRPSGSSEGYSIPKPKPSRPGIALDQNRIAELQKDTERVSAILGSIFAGAPVELEKSVTVEEEPEAIIEPTLLGLAGAQSAFVKTLLTRPQWSHAELEELAQDREFMLDGIMEEINDASFNKYEKPLLEGEDVVALNQEVVRELLQ